MSCKNCETDGILYSNVRIYRTEPNLLTGSLKVRVVYAERENQSITYQGVLYSQLDQKSEGKHIALVREITPDEFRESKHRNLILRFQKDCGLENLDSLEEMSRRGYRLFMHYIEKTEEAIVIAKELSVN